MSEFHAPLSTLGSWQLTGTADADVLYGGKGDNRVDAGAGDDIIHPGYGSVDSIGVYDGGDGVDTVVLGNGFSSWEVDYDAASGNYRSGNITLKNIEFVEFDDVRLTIEEAAQRGLTQHRFTEGDDHLVGNDLGYALQGGGGNDTFVGNGGNDTLYGGKGEDTAVYRGNRADYRIEFDYQDGSFVVTDGHAGRDGQDRLRSIEHLKFADAVVDFVFESGFPVTPVPASLALIDGVIGTPYVPPPPGDGVGGVIDDIVVGDLLVDFVTLSVAAGSVASGDGAVPVVLAGLPEAPAIGAGGFTLDLP